MSIIAYPLEATEYTAEDAQSYLSTRTSGVYSDEITFTPEGMTVTVSPFLAWFNYARFKGCSVAVTEPETLTFSPAHAVLDRIDRVVLRLDFSLNKAYFTVIEGVASSSPIPPEIIKTEAINDISPFYVKIRAGATEITSADITSTILNESVCGIMRDGVTGIPTAQLQSQAEELIADLEETIRDVKGESAFMIGSLYDPEKKSKPVAFDDEVIHKSGDEVTGIIKNVNRSSYAVVQKERQVNGEVYSVAVGSGLGQYAVTGSMEVARVTDGAYEVLARLDVGQEDIKYRNISGKIGAVYTEINKPSGVYTGNGKSVESISVGGTSKMLAVFKTQTPSEIWFVTPYGAINTHSSFDSLTRFVLGNLETHGVDLNASNTEYTYISL